MEQNHVIIDIKDYEELLLKVGNTLDKCRSKVASALKSIMVDTYWEIGRDIVLYEQNGHEKAEYGSEVLSRLSKDLTIRYGKGFSRSNVVYMRKLYNVYPNRQTLSD